METVTKAPKNTKLLDLINKVVPQPMNEEEFNKLPRSKKAVMIAKDALNLLRYNLIDPRHCYFSVWDEKTAKDVRLDLDDSATSMENKCLLFANQNCHVCAKGALFVSTVMRTNKMSAYDMMSEEVSHSTKVCETEKIFTHSEFDAIENAYEGVHYDKHPASINYSDKFEDDTERLAAILINIIRNKGKFMPSKIVKPSDVKRALSVKK